MRKIITALAMAAMSAGASAGTFGLHIGSKHSEPGYNDVNPGIMYRTDDGWTAGAYCNSESRSERFKNADRCEVSAYAGRTWDYKIVDGITAGVTVGAIVGYSRAPVLPMVIPSLKLGDNVRLLYAPKVEPKGVAVLSVLIEF